MHARAVARRLASIGGEGRPGRPEISPRPGGPAGCCTGAPCRTVVGRHPCSLAYPPPSLMARTKQTARCVPARPGATRRRAQLAASRRRLRPRRAPPPRPRRPAALRAPALPRLGLAAAALTPSAPQQEHWRQGPAQAAGHQGGAQVRPGHRRREEGATPPRAASGLPPPALKPQLCASRPAADAAPLRAAAPLPPGHRGAARDPQVPEEHRAAHPQAAVPAPGPRDCAGTAPPPRGAPAAGS